MKKEYLAGFLLSISVLVGLVCFIQFITPRSETGVQWILGLSAIRIFVGFIFLGLLLFNVGAMLFILIDLGPRQKILKKKISQFFADHYMPIMVTFHIALTLIGMFLLSMNQPVVPPL